MLLAWKLEIIYSSIALLQSFVDILEMIWKCRKILRNEFNPEERKKVQAHYTPWADSINQTDFIAQPS